MKRMNLSELHNSIGDFIGQHPSAAEAEVVIPSNELVGITGVEISPNNEYAILIPAHPFR